MMSRKINKKTTDELLLWLGEKIEFIKQYKRHASIPESQKEEMDKQYDYMVILRQMLLEKDSSQYWGDFEPKWVDLPCGYGLWHRYPKGESGNDEAPKQYMTDTNGCGHIIWDENLDDKDVMIDFFKYKGWIK